MRVRAYLLVSSLFLTLAGCSSTEILQPSVQTVTATVQGNTTRIFWLDERQRFPETLTELAIMGEHGQYSSEYRWRKGVVREIQREGNTLIDGELKHQWVLIRYDSEGQAVYQQYRLNGVLLPIRSTELVRYYQQAQKALEAAQTLGKNKKYFFQGHGNQREFEECGTGDVKTLKFTVAFPDDIQQRLRQEDNFIAAVGTVEGDINTVETMIVLGDGSVNCFEMPRLTGDKPLNEKTRP
ncbi:DUF1481 domain-containing protein [Grimontia hollisae]|nr:DUF1481 domain-containing protein [Grimontia hollisae]AMG30807.1 DUF1481 domain-containing protein [Grimontia hollisae]MDF2185475.1 DUF1481 domain-containing protein [Grimontia hollisae]STO47363.1 Protein of uncharacterised function (DUF1481) [Grimontia hollisae]STO56250.1 Protein of uncharacterised function (DUF1481) [Grimontia hollisae]STQ77211.1 Protein of uncharacterised function (DUF1481) [Grimontia hollisae]